MTIRRLETCPDDRVPGVHGDPEVALPALVAAPRGCGERRRAARAAVRGRGAAPAAGRPGPVRYEQVDRSWFAAFSGPMPRCRRREVFPVALGTLLGRHRRFVAVKWAPSARGRTGRPPTATALTNISGRLAGANPPGGHRRIPESRRGSGTGAPPRRWGRCDRPRASAPRRAAWVRPGVRFSPLGPRASSRRTSSSRHRARRAALYAGLP